MFNSLSGKRVASSGKMGAYLKMNIETGGCNIDKQDCRNVPIVHWLCDSPSPYNAQLFNALACEQDYKLTVHYRRLYRRFSPVAVKPD